MVMKPVWQQVPNILRCVFYQMAPHLKMQMLPTYVQTAQLNIALYL